MCGRLPETGVCICDQCCVIFLHLASVIMECKLFELANFLETGCTSTEKKSSWRIKGEVYQTERTSSERKQVPSQPLMSVFQVFPSDLFQCQSESAFVRTVRHRKILSSDFISDPASLHRFCIAATGLYCGAPLSWCT